MDEINKTHMKIKLENERRRRKRKLIKAVFFTCLFIFVTLISFLFFTEHSLKSIVLSPFLGSNRINIIVAGIDARNNDVGRADTLMLITIDPVAKKVYQISIPRDTRVFISDLQPPDDWDKINATNAYGGPEVTKRTVEEFLGIKVDYWVDLRFKAFADAIDKIGGLTIDIEAPMHYEDPWDDDGGLIIDFQPGTQKLNGKKAIEYVRYRDYLGDIGRVQRQSVFVNALLNQVATPVGIINLPGVVKDVYGELNTDMPLSLMLSLIAILPDVKNNGVVAQMVPGGPLYIDGISYWIPDIVKTREMVAKVEGIVPDATYMEEANQLAEKYTASIPDESRTSVEAPTDEAKTLIEESKTGNQLVAPSSSNIISTKPKRASDTSTAAPKKMTPKLPARSTNSVNNNSVGKNVNQ
ncbi:MAG: LCP family protein [Negativicutes bacterium]|jgi:LCP family protein required for cell wall assembly